MVHAARYKAGVVKGIVFLCSLFISARVLVNSLVHRD
jgi:hypothetical protein